MPIRLYNSLTKQKEELVPLKDKTIRMYACGVTVYDQCHIGHARSLYVFEVIRRYLQYRGYDVHFVRNITDIDDKIIEKAKEFKKKSEEVVKENIDAYYRDLRLLGIAKADVEPKATENIPDMIQHIEGLIQKGYAYEVAGDVYFSVRKFPDYGKLSGQSIDKMLEAVRIEKASNKKDPLDFALWKKSKEGEPFWDSPWGLGRPGWHIECSCMSMKHLHTQTLDIHAGGQDLIFPHHENEIAQSEALTKSPFAKYWLHHGLLTINGQKMSKSLGNFITVEEALKKYPVDDLKLLFLFSHYASPVDFTQEKMAEAHKALDRFDILFWKVSNILHGEEDFETREEDFIVRHKDAFLEAMDDDFNTPRALGALFDLVNDTNKFIDSQKSHPQYKSVIYTAVDTMEDFLKNIFGLYAHDEAVDLTEESRKLLEERKKARASKNFKKSDEIRALLKQKGIIVEDGPQGQTWRFA